MKSFTRIAMIGMVFFFSAMICSLFAWGTDVRVTADSTVDSTCNNNGWGVAAYGDTITIFSYFSDRHVGGADTDCYVRRLHNGTWGGEIRLFYGGRPSQHPCISGDGPYFSVVWQDSVHYQYEVLYRPSTNYGYSWNAGDSVTHDGDDHESYHPCCRAYSDRLSVVWRDDSSSQNGDICYKYYNGSSWGSRSRVDTTSASSDFPSIAVTRNCDDAVWQDSITGDWDIWHRRTTNSGSSWGDRHNITDHDSAQMRPCVVYSNSYINAVWMDRRNGNWDIYYARSTDGATWTQLRNLTSGNSDDQKYPNIAGYGANIHVVWIDSIHPDTMKVCYRKSHNTGASWHSTEQVNDDTSSSCMNASVALSHKGFGIRDSVYVHVSWCDDRDDSAHVYYDHYSYAYLVESDPEGGEQCAEGNIPQTLPKELMAIPNVTTRKTDIQYSVQAEIQFEIRIYDTCGKLVNVLNEGSRLPGTYCTTWNCTTGEGDYVKPGVYFIKAMGYKPIKVVILR